MKYSLPSRRCFTGVLTLAAGLLLATAHGQEPAPAPSAAPAPVSSPEAITFLPLSATAPISAAVAVPAGQALLMTSGTVPPVLDEKAPAGSPARYGDTKTQGAGALRNIQAQLQKAGLGLRDVIYLRVYVAPDKTKDGHCDFPGWFAAYGEFFGTPENPVKPARSTVGVATLVNPDLLIEIEAVAAYPGKGPSSPAK
jgi:enamine deaminase RidA (YjgF/YER057c/UK114 family)